VRARILLPIGMVDTDMPSDVFDHITITISRFSSWSGLFWLLPSSAFHLTGQKQNV